MKSKVEIRTMMPCSDLGLADGNISNLDQACPFPPHPLFFPFSKKCTTRKGQGSMFSPNKPLLPSTGKKRQSTFNNKKGAKYNEVQYFSIPLQNFFFFNLGLYLGKWPTSLLALSFLADPSSDSWAGTTFPPPLERKHVITFISLS